MDTRNDRSPKTAHSQETDAKSDSDLGCVADSIRLRAIIERWPRKEAVRWQLAINKYIQE